MKTGKRMGALFLVLTLLGGLWGCRKPAARYFSYLDAPFCAELAGKIDGLAFAATLTSEGRATVGTMPAATLTFTSPASLAGVEVQYYPETGWKARLGDLEGAADGTGMGEVAALLLTERSVSATRREAGCVILSLDGGVTLYLDEKTNRPIRVTCAANGRLVEVAVAGWE
jgi:hypothetical protein